MSSRPEGFGLTAEVRSKIDSKYDSDLEVSARGWINSVMGARILSEAPNLDDFAEQLKNGVILCKLINKLEPGSIKKINESKMAFKMMENIGNFLDACYAYGVKKEDLFQTVDLYEAQNMPQVVVGIMALSRKSGAKGNKLAVGPKESTEQKREFTEEQKKQGQSVIGLQMGTNKGASQSGISFGAQRQIH